MKILVTGAAGFIGYHTARRLLERGDEVVGLDNLNAYYDPRLKDSRLKLLAGYPAFRFVKLDLADSERIGALFSSEQFHRVVHLAAQAGVRYSLTHPRPYIDSNIVGFLNILEGARNGSVEHLVYASSSSVYGSNVVTPFSVRQSVDHPISMYAATKKANELMAHSYSHLFRIPTTGLRFFTVYGPWGRPDMALFLFTRAMLAGEPIDVFNHGKMQRDFTYIDDIVTGVVRVLDKAPVPNPSWDAASADPGSSSAPYKLYNIGNNNPVQLLDLIKTLEKALGLKAEMRMKEMQPGDVPATFADVDDLVRDVGFRPSTPIDVGVQRFVDWYREHYSNT
jgi:UDP-glucuronate 4-epimerase